MLDSSWLADAPEALVALLAALRCRHADVDDVLPGSAAFLAAVANVTSQMLLLSLSRGSATIHTLTRPASRSNRDAISSGELPA